jgi:ABC-type multidrug transport system fused ATPase/permease subunit
MTQSSDPNTELRSFLEERFNEIDERFNKLEKDIADSNTKVDQFQTRFDDYRTATQWVVQLAFGLIASATVITVVSSVFRR